MTDESSSPLGGGSAAGQAYRAQLAKEAAAKTPAKAAASGGEPAAAAVAKPSDARTAERKKVVGRARMVFPGGETARSVKMVDISLHGVCVLMDDVLAVKKACTLECDIFLNGAHKVFSVPAISVYCVLASGHGFKVGFQFGPPSPTALKAIADILA